MRSLRSHDDASHEVFDSQGAADVAFDASIDVADLVRDEIPESTPETPKRHRARVRERELLGASTPRVAVAEPEPAATSVCLACGASPPLAEGECRHDEVAHLTATSMLVAAAVKRLQTAVNEARAHERALRRLVAVEVSSGRGALESARLPAALTPTPREGPCVTCGHRSAALKSARRKALTDAQVSFAFEASTSTENGR